MGPSRTILRAESVSMQQTEGETVLSELHGVSLQIEQNSFVQICGEAGSGRRLLFDLLGWLEAPAFGDIYFNDISSRSLAPDERGNHRNQFFGFLFEAPYLIPAFSVVENVAMPLFKVSGANARDARGRTEEVLDFVGLSQDLDAVSLHLPTNKQFRCALARALVNLPQVLFLEEPGGAANAGDRRALRDLAHAAIKRFGVTVVWTSTLSVASASDRILQLEEGVIVSDSAQIESRADAS